MSTFATQTRLPASPLETLLSARAASLALAAPLSAEDMMLQSMPDASPVKWHLAHTTWFFETFLLRPYLPNYQPFHEDFLRVFNSYYKQVGEHPNRARRGLFSRPALQQVLDYRAYVDEFLAQLLTKHSTPEIENLVTLGANHEQQHQELILTDIKHALWSQPLQQPYFDGVAPRYPQALDREWTYFSGGIHSIGYDGNSFCFDNEQPCHEVLLQPFRLASRLVTNAEYLEFIAAGGYREPSPWLSEGWDMVLREGWSAPLYWQQQDREWQQYTLHGWQPLDLNAPVCHISYFEADAYARWRDARLPLESEWEVAAASQSVAGRFVEELNEPVDPNAATSLFGDVWQWTASPYTAYPGFHPAPGAIGEYNGKFMCNQYVLRGGSCATPRSHIRASYRNFFPAHIRWQFCGLRLAADAR